MNRAPQTFQSREKECLTAVAAIHRSDWEYKYGIRRMLTKTCLTAGGKHELFLDDLFEAVGR
jgi:hypothetical protein